MLKGGPLISRHALVATGSRNSVRVVLLRQVRLLATEAAPVTPIAESSGQQSQPPPPPKKRAFLPRFLFYSSVLGIVFYGSSTVVALNSDRYHDFFVETIPFGDAVIAHAEHEGWDRYFRAGPAKQIVDAGKSVYSTVEGALTRTFGSPDQKSTSGSPTSPPRAGQAAPPGSKITALATEAKEKARSAAQTVVRKVHDNTAAVQRKAEKVEKVAEKDIKKAERVFSDDVKELVEEVEAALAGRPYKKGAGTALPDAESLEPLPAGLKVYTLPLPIGHQPPPGYVLPSDLKKKVPKPSEAKSGTPSSLPLVAPVVSKLSASEPIVAQLAQSIDNLAGFLRENPSAAQGGAKDVLKTAEADLTQLGERLEKIKEEERQKLETKLDDQAREYNLKLLEMEAEAQDKIDRQEEDWKSLFDEERAKIMNQYRQKLQRELETQQELINQRLKEEVIAQGIELQRRWMREIKVRVEQERGGRLAKLDDLATNVKRLERVTLDNSTYIDENVSLHSLWSAIRAVTAAIDAPKRKPFREELRVLHNVAAARADPVLTSALETLETSTTPDVGVEPLSDLTSWFLTNVSPKVESVALVPDQGAGLLSHVASAILSKFRFKPHGLVEGHDVLSVLARAEHHMNEKDLDGAARELNQLTGWPKLLLTDWLAAARARLEVQQALEVIQIQATLASLLVLETK
ncbi:Formation of crista junctions protein 1 [Tulasnella sp. 403]|nr:Formation of crista junctions protein 1 [Tulasnella sp. 403]